jgi:hypothetical protein
MDHENQEILSRAHTVQSGAEEWSPRQVERPRRFGQEQPPCMRLALVLGDVRQVVHW